MRDFFISYTGADRMWAEWIAWELEEAGYMTILQAWDFEAGAHFVSEMHKAMQIAERTIAVLSNEYVNSAFGEAEWQEAWRADPGGVGRKLLIFRIESCSRPGLLGQLVSEDLFGVGKEVARSRLLAAVRKGRRKPTAPPEFPLQEAPAKEVPFPGRLVTRPLEEALIAGGPLTPDNPFAVALAFWYIALEDDYENLHTVITPESQGQWNLAEVRHKTETGGITTGVNKPCYDISYVRIMVSVPNSDNAASESAMVVSGGFMLTEGRIVSLVLRPELDGWRVHGFGPPLEPEAMPRTWRPE